MLYTLNNGRRTTRFEGEKLVHATSRGHTVPADALRWTDVDVYRTRAGAYVLHKVGRSRVYCVEDDASDTAERLVVARVGRDDPQRLRDLAPCPVCRPGPILGHREVWAETDRGSVSVSDTAAGLVESCYSRDDDGVTFVTKTTRWALDDLSKRDPAVADAWLVEDVA